MHFGTYKGSYFNTQRQPLVHFPTLQNPFPIQQNSATLKRIFDRGLLVTHHNSEREKNKTTSLSNTEFELLVIQLEFKKGSWCSIYNHILLRRSARRLRLSGPSRLFSMILKSRSLNRVIHWFENIGIFKPLKQNLNHSWTEENWIKNTNDS